MITYTTFLWGEGYGEHYVRKLQSAVERNTAQSRFVCFTDTKRPLLKCEQRPIQDIELTQIKGCFARLRLFDPDTQRQMGLKEGDRIVNLDLDLVVTGHLDELFDVDGFAILQDINTTNKCRYNGSVWSLTAGFRPDVWSDFSLENYHKYGVPFHAFPDDQGWFEHKMPDAVSLPDVYGFKKRGWPAGDKLPENAKIVCFPGWRDPSKFTHLDWVAKHWQ